MATEQIGLVTGSSGFIGSHLLNVLRDSWPALRVVACARTPRPEHGECIQLDLLDASAVHRTVSSIRPDYVFHLAGELRSSQWRDLYRGNVEATLHLLEALRGLPNAPRIVIAGSAAEYGEVESQQLPICEDVVIPNPVSRYGVAKAWQTIAAHHFAGDRLTVMVGRMFNLIGKGLPESSALGTFAAQIKNIQAGTTAPQLRVGNLAARRDFVDVRDACRALLDLARMGIRGNTYNICSGVPVRIGDILDSLLAAAGIQVEVIAENSRYRTGDVPDSFGSPAKINALTGWAPQIPLRASVGAMLN